TETRLLLDFLVVADDCLADAAEQGARRKSFLQGGRNRLRLASVSRGEENQGEVRIGARRASDSGTNLVEGLRRLRLRRDRGGEWHGGHPSSEDLVSLYWTPAALCGR